MEFIKPQKFAARVSEKYFLTENERFLYVKCELVLPDRVHFFAGQYVSIDLRLGGERRSYSIATTPDTDHGFSLVAHIIPDGKGSQFLRNLELGGEMDILAPLGRFVVEDGTDKLLFVATGSGIVPIYSMITDLLLNKHDTRQIRLHWGLRSEENIFWFDNLERLAEEHPNLVFDPVLSQPSENWSLCSGRVQDCLKRDFATENLSKWSGYVCGNPVMVEQVTALLPDLGMMTEHIYSEKF